MTGLSSSEKQASPRLVVLALCARCLLRDGTVLAFDELFGRPELASQEWRALEEASASCGFSYSFLTWMLHPRVSLGQVSLRLHNVTACGRRTRPA